MKTDNDYQVMLKAIRREVANAQPGKNVPGGPNFVSNYSFSGGGGGFGGGDSTATAVKGFGYTGDGIAASEFVQSRLIGQGAIYLVDDVTNDQICIRMSPICDPAFYTVF